MSSELLEAIANAPQCLVAAMESAADGERRRDVLFYSGATVPRFDWFTGEEYDLTFDMDGGDLSRLAEGAPVLNGHSGLSVSDVLGVVENPRRSERGYEASLRFSERDGVAGVWQDIESGILRNVSMGVSIKKLVADDSGGKKRKKYLATAWEPFEISVVPMGADPGAKFLAADPRLVGLLQKSVISGAASKTENSETRAREALALRQRRFRVLGH